MSPARILFVQDAIAAATRVLADPGRNACRISQDEVVTLCALALQQHAMIVAHGLAYPQLPAGRSEARA